MDRPPIDVDALARMANELFRGEAPAPGPAEMPSAAVAAPAEAEVGVGRGLGQMPNVPAGGAAFSPSAPPTRPAFGRAVSAESPDIGYGTGQPRTGSAPVPDAGFDPQSLPGFGQIPHVEDGFDIASLTGVGAVSPASLGQLPGSESGFDVTRGPSAVPGLASPNMAPSGPTGLPSGLPQVPGLDALGVKPSNVPAGGAAFSPASLPTRPAFGRAVSAEPPPVGYGTGQPRVGPTPEPGLPGAPGFDFQDYFGATSLSPHVVPQGVTGLDLGGLEKAAAPYLAPADVPGAAPAPGAAATSYPGPEALARTTPRSIDRPTPSPFEFTDAPHLGEFAEESILRRSLDPQFGAPAIEGLAERPTPLPEPYAAGLQPSPSPSFYFLDDRTDYFANDVPDVPRPTATPFNAEAVRRDFPVLNQRVNGHPLIWLDNGATTQKPQPVIDRIARFYETENSNISRSAHTLAAGATEAYEDARKTVQRFLGASSVEEIVFLRGTTEAINLVAQTYGRRFIKEGDEILVTHGEHHANIVPWYNLAKEVGAHLKVAPFDDNGDIMLDEYEQLLNHKVKIVATTHVANAIGTILPVKAMTEMAHRHGIPVLVDGAQSVSHMPIDVQDIDCDFFVFSGHKVFAPTGIGALYGKKALLDQMPPWQGGGNMIADVTFERITFQPPPLRFEAGTSNIADAIGLAEALKYVEKLGMTNIEAYEHSLLDYAVQKLATIKGLTIIGRPRERAGVVSFLLEGKEPVEVGKALDQKGIAVRAGHHCALPILRRYGVEATVRPAFAMYNTFEDADRLTEAVREIAAN